METEDTRLSYSSWSELQTCEQKYVFRKVLKTPVDNEEEDRSAFDVGSATHHCVEVTEWGKKDLTKSIVDEAIKQYPDAEPSKELVFAMAMKLIQHHKDSGWECVKAEQQITNPKYNGFIDLIAKKPNGTWCIVDLKTSSFAPNDGLIARLPLDRQLNLYSYFAPQIAPHLELDINKFMGCIYRVVVKSKANQKATESSNAFVNRLFKLLKVYDVVIPKELLQPKEIYDMFEDGYVKSQCLRNGEVPTKNFGACFSYFKLCPYFSQCHGHKSDDIINMVKVKTNSDYAYEASAMEDL